LGASLKKGAQDWAGSTKEAREGCGLEIDLSNGDSLKNTPGELAMI